METIFFAFAIWVVAVLLLCLAPTVLRWLNTPKLEKQTTFLWWSAGEGNPGYGLVGREVEIEGRTGKVISRTDLTITVEWDR